MGRNVFANGMEVSAKAADNQSIAAMPDVCLSPPSPPAGPIPIPYPNFSQASDTANGTRTVQIGGKEVGQKTKSYYRTSKGDEAATRALGLTGSAGPLAPRVVGIENGAPTGAGSGDLGPSVSRQSQGIARPLGASEYVPWDKRSLVRDYFTWDDPAVGE